MTAHADRGGGIVAALAVLLAAALALAFVLLALDGPGQVADLDAVAFVVGSAAGTGLLVLRAARTGRERATWWCFAGVLVCNAVAAAMWSFGFSQKELSPADAVWTLGNVLAFVGVVHYLRHRVGDAYGALWLEVVGIAVYTAAICTAIFVPRIVEHGYSTGAATLNIVYVCIDGGLWSLLLAVGSMSGRRLQRQDVMLTGAFMIVCAINALYVLALAGTIGKVDAIVGVGWGLATVLICAAAWAPPSAAGAIRVGGWWEVGPTVSWMLTGGVLLLIGHFTPIPTVASALALAAIVLAALRTALVTRDVRSLVVHRRQALTDDLTGLPNRRALGQHLELLTRDGAANGRQAALLIADLDGFKELNDALGHSAGDALLVEVGRRLSQVRGAWALRLGGDEFAAVVEAPHDPQVVARQILEALSRPVSIDEVTVAVAASIGIARFPQDATTSGELLRRADVAMYDAKRRRAGVATYAPERDGYTRTRVTLAADLQRAIEDPSAAGLWVAFQPQVRMDTRAVVGVEALIRWSHPEHGAVSPAELLPLAERTGTLGRLTDWIVDRSVATAAAWHAAGQDARISVNVSALTLIDVGLPGRVLATLRRHGLPPGALVVEVTEDAVMSDPQRCCEVLDALAAQGVGISVDDFGTGQSSLAQLRRIGAGELKIDRSFVLGMTGDRFDREVVSAVAGLGRRLGMRLVAEGVEDPAAWQALVAIGCDVAQGYGIARPMPADALLELLASDPAPLARVLRAA
jgi:diguanylate cyclase (GGDEF)-like protein